MTCSRRRIAGSCRTFRSVADGLEKIMKAKHAALSKKYPLPEEMQKIKAALIRFGLGRGYEYDDVYAAACKCCGGKPTLR